LHNVVMAPEPDATELEQLERLVDIQRQIVELTERNAAIQQDCAVLREALRDEFERTRPRRFFFLRWFQALRPRRPLPPPAPVPLRLHSA
jgi:hypothetical protein